MRNAKSKIIIVMLVMICLMVTGYGAFSTSLTITGTSNITSEWNVVFTSITEVSKTSGVTIVSSPTASGTSATFDVGLSVPGDKIVYQITIENKGTLDAIIQNIEATATDSSAIIFSISDINIGDTISNKTTKTFNVTIEYDPSVTSQPDKTNKVLTVDITLVQYAGQSIDEEVTIIDQPMLLSTAILNHNVAYADNVASPYVTSSTGIDISSRSSDTNGKGLYYTSSNTEGNLSTYYFRGAVTNNYVKFGKDSSGNDLYWRIMRINEDGSIRLITQDIVGYSAFNENTNDNAYVGYMYGTAGSSTYEETHANTNDSTIKDYLDSWYENNLKINYGSYLADAGFCNDRSLYSGAGYGTNQTYYGGNEPQFKCPQTNDLFTTSSSTKGNRALNYPIGLITEDESVYAGHGDVFNISDYYLYISIDYWSMTPNYFGSYAYGAVVNNSDEPISLVASGAYGVRPVINLKSTVEITGGDGTSTNPYVVKTN